MVYWLYSSGVFLKYPKVSLDPIKCYMISGDGELFSSTYGSAHLSHTLLKGI